MTSAPPQPPAPAAHPASLVPRRTYHPEWPGERFIVPLLAARIEAAIARHAPAAAAGGAAALDVGCGRQPFRARLEGLGLRYVGMDARQSPEGTVDVVAPIDGDLPPAAAAAGPFGFVLCTEVLEHVVDWDRAFRNLTALTAPGGRIVVTCPHVYPLHEEPYDYWRPTPHALRWHAERAGLRVVELEQAGTAWDVVGTVLGALHVLPRGPGLWHRAVRKAVAAGRRAALAAVGSPAVRRLVDLQGMYLANIAVFERPGGAAGRCAADDRCGADDREVRP